MADPCFPFLLDVESDLTCEETASAGQVAIFPS